MPCGTEKLKLADIQSDPWVSARKTRDESLIRELADLITTGVKLDPPVVFKDNKGLLWMGDGGGRREAYESRNYTTVECEVREGSRREAYLYSLKINGRHGAPLSLKDRKANVRQFLLDPEWRIASNREIAEWCGLSDKTVGQIRGAMEATAEIPQLTERVGKDKKARKAKKTSKKAKKIKKAPNTDLFQTTHWDLAIREKGRMQPWVAAPVTEPGYEGMLVLEADQPVDVRFLYTPNGHKIEVAQLLPKLYQNSVGTPTLKLCVMVKADKLRALKVKPRPFGNEATKRWLAEAEAAPAEGPAVAPVVELPVKDRAEPALVESSKEAA